MAARGQATSPGMLPATPAVRWDAGDSSRVRQGKDAAGRAERKDCPNPLPPAAGGLLTPRSPTCFGRGWMRPGGPACPQQGIAAVGAHPGRDVRRHRLPQPGRFAARQDPTAPGSGRCCRFLHPTEPSGTQAQAGCGHSSAHPNTPCVYPHLPAMHPSGFFPPAASEQLIFILFPAGQGNSQGLSSCWKCWEGEMGFSFSLPCCEPAAVTRGGMHSPLPSPSNVAESGQQRARVSYRAPTGFSAAGCGYDNLIFVELQN